MHRFRGARRAARGGPGHRLCRLRLHRRQPACRQPDADHAAALVPEDRPQADRADGRRHDARSATPPGKDEARQLLVRRADRPQHGRASAQVFAKFLQFGDGADRRGHGQQRRLARRIALHPVAARCRAAFLGQPHADAGQRAAAARTRPAAQLSRIQLPDPAGLRFRRAGAPLRTASCRWAAPTSGATSSRGVELARRTRRARPVRPDDAADRRPRRAPRWARPRRARSGSMPSGCRPTSTGSSGAIPRTPMSAAFCASSPNCRSPRSRKLEGLRDAEINEAKKVLATEATALCHGREAAEAAAETAREVFEAGGAGGELPQVALPRDVLDARHSGLRIVRARRACRLQRRSAAADQGRRRPDQRCRREERDAIGVARRSRCAGADQAQRRPQAPRPRPPDLILRPT